MLSQADPPGDVCTADPTCCRPGEGRDPPLPWIPAFAGMTTAGGCDDFLDPALRPIGESQAGAGAGRGAVAGLIERPFEREMLDRAGDRDPVADLRAAGIEFFTRQGLDRRGVLAAQQVD